MACRRSKRTIFTRIPPKFVDDISCEEPTLSSLRTELRRERSAWNFSKKAWLQRTVMKEDSIECNPSPVVLISENNRKVERSIVYSMVHIIAVGLPLVVILIAQPGSSKFRKKYFHEANRTTK